MTLADWGWSEEWAERAAREGIDPSSVARVVGQDRASWSVQTDSGPERARIATRRGVGPAPVVGDWVAVEPGPVAGDPRSILRVLPRRTAVSRGAAGTGGGGQVLAANVDRVWIVHGLDLPVNPRRLERYLAVVWESGAVPEILLTKTDLAADPEGRLAEARTAAPGASVRRVSAEDPDSVRRLRESLAPGCTVSLLGPSGVGKSTLVNLLAGEILAETGEVRAHDRKGRHTTVRRELFRIPGGALLLDTPGMRELRIGALDDGLRETFSEIEELARACRFRDCRHEAEPGCAVLAAADRGTLDPGRLASYRKLQAEAAYEARKADPLARAAALSDWKTAMKTLRNHPKYRNRE
jgi:ribosome biogenesis GTPase